MAVNDVFWSGSEAYDIHVVAGATSRTLDDLLAINHGPLPGADVWANTPPAGVTVRFHPAIVGASALGTFSSTTVDVSESTGAVTAKAALPARFVHNFLIRATVTDPAVARPFVQEVRVHVHHAIRRVWLTPDTLTVHSGAPEQKFSVLAEFDDDTVGDITRMRGLTWVSSAPLNISVAADGKLTALLDGVGSDVKVTLPAAYGGATTTARAESAAAPWSDPVAATLLPRGAGAARMTEPSVPNFLFLPDGFTSAEKGLFETMVQKYVSFLQTHSSTRPFDLCKHEMNYWMAWVPSRERGTNTMYEVVPPGADGVCTEMPNAVALPTPPPAGLWTIEQMIHEVGLPIPAQRGVALGVQQAEWTALFGAGPGAHVDAALHTAWMALANRRLVHERDTAFGLGIGGRPNVQDPSYPRTLTFHPLRTTRTHLDQLVKNITNRAGGATIGAVWDRLGKDRALIVVLCAGARRCGGKTVAPNELLATSMDASNDVKVALIAGTRGVTLVPNPIPQGAKGPPLDSKAMVAHESAHALTLGDEYGTSGTLPASKAKDVKAYLNLQDEAGAQTLPPALDPNKLKWKWPRIAKAGVLTAAPVAAGAEFTVSLRPGHAAQFKVGDVVQLRTRPLTAGIVPSGECAVTAKPGGNDLTLRPLAAGALVPANFAGGSVVYVQTRGRVVPPAVVGPPLELISPTVLAHMTTTGIPLNIAAVAPAAHVCTPDPSVVQYALNVPATLPKGKPKYTAWIVGAFEGGMDFGCGVLHPTGACMMRSLVLDETSAKAEFNTREVAYSFCHVCRYILVDRFDPFQHAVIDADYAKRYAEP
jgi:hypothetical protein